MESLFLYLNYTGMQKRLVFSSLKVWTKKTKQKVEENKKK